MFDIQVADRTLCTRPALPSSHLGGVQLEMNQMGMAQNIWTSPGFHIKIAGIFGCSSLLKYLTVVFVGVDP